MRILQAGVAKSGNLWLYRIVQEILDAAGIERRSFIREHAVQAEAKHWPLSFPEQGTVDVLDMTPDGCFCRISSRFREPLPDVAAYLDACTHVWTHSPFSEASREVLGRVDVSLYIVRDPRDVLLSKADFATTPYMRENFPSGFATARDFVEARLDKIIRGWRRHVTGYLEAAEAFGIRVVFYERLLGDFSGELEGLCQTLGVDLDDAARERVMGAVQFATMRRSAAGHVNRGRFGRWRDELTPSEITRVREIAGDLMDCLGYPTDAAAFDPERLPRYAGPVPALRGSRGRAPG